MKKRNELSENIRNAVEVLDTSIAQAMHGIRIQGMWESVNIRGLTDDDKIYLRDEVIRLLRTKQRPDIQGIKTQ